LVWSETLLRAAQGRALHWNLNTSGVATGTQTDSSGCGSVGSTQTFTITALNAQGFRTANLSCGTCGLGFNFTTQVAANIETFSWADVADGSANILAGTAAVQTASAITIDQLAL
jgi:hypothetical protein